MAASQRKRFRGCQTHQPQPPKKRKLRLSDHHSTLRNQQTSTHDSHPDTEEPQSKATKPISTTGDNASNRVPPTINQQSENGQQVVGSSSTCQVPARTEPAVTPILQSCRILEHCHLDRKPRGFRNMLHAALPISAFPDNRNGGSCYINASLQCIFAVVTWQRILANHAKEIMAATSAAPLHHMLRIWQQASNAQDFAMCTRRHDELHPAHVISAAGPQVTDEDMLALTYAAAMQNSTPQASYANFMCGSLLPALILRRFYGGSQDDSNNMICAFLTSCPHIRESALGFRVPVIVCSQCSCEMESGAAEDETWFTSLQICGENPETQRVHRTIAVYAKTNDSFRVMLCLLPVCSVMLVIVVCSCVLVCAVIV